VVLCTTVDGILSSRKVAQSAVASKVIGFPELELDRIVIGLLVFRQTFVVVEFKSKLLSFDAITADVKHPHTPLLHTPKIARHVMRVIARAAAYKSPARRQRLFNKPTNHVDVH
jgi:hypothetical protein